MTNNNKSWKLFIKAFIALASINEEYKKLFELSLIHSFDKMIDTYNAFKERPEMFKDINEATAFIVIGNDKIKEDKEKFYAMFNRDVD